MTDVNLLVRDKHGLSLVTYDHSGKRLQSTNLLDACTSSPRQCKYTISGSTIAYSSASEVVIEKIDVNHQTEFVWRIPVAAVDFSLSPSGKYVCIFLKPPMPNLTTGEPAAQIPNLRIWKLSRSNTSPIQEIVSLQHRHQNSWGIQWTAEENFFARLVLPNEVHFHRAEDPSKVAFRIHEENLANFAISSGPYPKVAIFIKEAKGEPAAIKVFLLPNTSTPVAQKLFFKADKIEFQWSPIGKHLLALTHTEVDATGQSYYGENNLYFISGDGSFDCRVALDKSGPVHDMAWGPRGDEFIVCYGYMPSKITLFNLKCEAAFQFPVESKNHVRYSPVGNLVCFGGFGNLPGNIEIWTRSGTVLKRIAAFQAPSSSICEWSPSGHFLITGIVTPRLRVDNGFRVWSWKGEELEKTPYTELYQASWRPSPDVKFPLVDFSKATMAAISFNVSSSEPIKKEAYRPPALRNKTTVSTSAGLKNNIASVKPQVAIQLATINSGLSNREKNIRKLERKLEQIRELKAKLADGAQLELNQIEKIKSEEEVERELQQVLAASE